MANAPTAPALRALFFAIPATRRQIGTDLRLARIQVGDEWLVLGELSALEVEALTEATAKATSYSVKYFDRAASRASKPSIKTRRFDDAAEAAEFAGRNTLYGVDCSVAVSS